MRWWTEARFGMFIHWGLYAQPARHEWVKKPERLTNEDYQKYFDVFNPDLYDPHEWARMAKASGMKYAVITSKHHEGFCLFDSKYTDYKARTLSYGDQRRLEIARALATEPKLIALHEPAAGMNSTEKIVLRERIDRIRKDGRTILLIEHDVDARRSPIVERLFLLPAPAGIGPPSSARS